MKFFGKGKKRLFKGFGIVRLVFRVLLYMIIAVFIFSVGSVLFLHAPDVEPAPYAPPIAPKMEGALRENSALNSVKLLAKGKLNGPEDIAVDSDGTIYTGLEDGRIVKISSEGDVKSFAETGGRPLGLQWGPRGDLIVADGGRGLLSVNPKGEVTVLVPRAETVPLEMADDLDVSSSGLIYFSDATGPEVEMDYYQDLMIHRPYGRLLRFDYYTDELEVLLTGLYFANGVALSPDEDYVLVSEMSEYRITRLWLKGPRKGKSEVFADNLPGFPDGISGDGNGNYWVALVSPRMWFVDNIVLPNLWLRKLLMHFPKWTRLSGSSYGLIIQLNSEGEIVESLHDPSGKSLSGITNVVERDGKLYIGTLEGDAIGVYDREFGGP
ncbi:MAG: SMP-30/gluconolactonase/LRE family protein [Candidatus Marinimicrobia bacterium]|jgi:sugar lactone lactonase YvrE|nr:SMP-30/gluconolactonase/LRE family protein [Candidatus Neomarinimicrobiota bacterium]